MRTIFLKVYRSLCLPQKGFILWEIIIGLAVFGVIAGIGVKMWRVVDHGRFTRTSEQIHSIVNSLRNYRCAHGVLPEEERLSEDALTDACDAVWDGLSGDQWIDGVIKDKTGYHKYPKNALGGGAGLIRTTFNAQSGIWLVLAKETNTGLKGSLFTPKEANQLARTWGDGSPNSDFCVVREGEDSEEGRCVSDGKFANHSKRACIVYVFVLE